MTCLFFGLLPADLQIDILHAWLNAADCGCSLLAVLSALDVACSMSEQPSLRFLMAQLPPFGEGPAHCVNRRATIYITRRLQWLVSRNVPATTLLAGTVQHGHDPEVVGSNLTLPLVETLHWNVFNSTTEHLTAVLQYLPNLTAIYQEVHSGATVDASLVPKLKVLGTAGHPRPSWSPFTGACLELQALRMRHFPLTAELAEHLKECCPHLQLLGVSMQGVEFSNVFKVVRACVSLQELVLYNLRGIKITEVVVALPNIKRLTFNGSYHNFGHIMEVFDGVKEVFAALDYLGVGSFVFAPKEGRLRVGSYYGGVSSEQFAKILSGFWFLGEVESHSVLDSNMTSMLVDRFGGMLKSLTVQVAYRELETLLHGCGRFLVSLTIFTCPLALIAASCPVLVTLSLAGGASDCSEEVGFSALSCTDLKDFKLTVGFWNTKERQAVLSLVAQKLRLRLLVLHGFDDADAEWFRKRVRVLQLLPVPTIVIVKQSTFARSGIL